MTPPPPPPSTYADPSEALVPVIAPWGSHVDALGGAQARRDHLDRSAADRARRSLNVAVALAGLLIAAPVMLVVALLVKLTSPGPVIYRQPRVGLDRRRRAGFTSSHSRRRDDRGGRIFTIYKFRTMRVENDAAQVWSSRRDPRVTPIGRVLRATRLDELPQLYNVLRGDMNIVGPRPEQPEIFRDLSTKIVNYRERQRVLPGITGLAQVSQGYDACLDDVKKKVALDLEYLERRSAPEDLMIMAKTVPVMVFQKVWM